MSVQEPELWMKCEKCGFMPPTLERLLNHVQCGSKTFHAASDKDKRCVWCYFAYTNWSKHKRECPEWQQAAYRSRHRGHRAMGDWDMRLSGRHRSGGLDS